MCLNVKKNLEKQADDLKEDKIPKTEYIPINIKALTVKKRADTV